MKSLKVVGFVSTFGWSRKYLLPLLLLSTLPLSAQAQFNYVTNDGTITITGYTGPGGDVTIPDTINGLAVTIIGDFAFTGRSLTSVTIPDSVTVIGEQAFNTCRSLTNVTMGNGLTNIGLQAFAACTSLRNVAIPDSLVSIGDGAFLDCRSLTSAEIPKSVTIIQEYAFGGCNGLTNITVDPLNPAYSSVDGVLFDKNQTTLIQYPGATTVGSYVIPDSVTNIVGFAFDVATNLTTVTIPKSVTSFEYPWFFDCYSLTNISVDSLNSVYSSVDGVLFDKSQSTLIEYPPAKPGSYVIPNSVGSLGVLAFGNCGRLISVTIPTSVINIGSSAFIGCVSLTTVTIPNSVATIEHYTFEYCSNLTSVTIPASVTIIGDSAFAFCGQLAAVYFQGDAPEIDYYPWTMFQGDTNVVYYLPGTTGWGATFGERPTALWALPYPQTLTTAPSFGVQTNQFGFMISWATNLSVVVEASTALAHPVWVPLSTNALVNGWSYFSDPAWTNYPARFYRIRSL